MSWASHPENLRRLERSHRFAPGEMAVMSAGRWVLCKHPDEPMCTDGQFPCPTMQVIVILSESARPGGFGEFVHALVRDESGAVREGWIGRWNPRPGDAIVQPMVISLADV